MSGDTDKERQRNRLAEGLLSALPERHFGAILADPPWKFTGYVKDQNPASSRSASRHYNTMTLDQIKAMPVAALAKPEGSHLFLWVTGPHLKQGIEVLEAWGYRYSGMGFVWLKLRRGLAGEQMSFSLAIEREFHFGMGHTTRKNAEFVLLGRRGVPHRNSRKVRELIISPLREHSRKPDEIFPRIEAYCDGPYLELFSRQERPNWTCRGDEKGKFK